MMLKRESTPQSGTRPGNRTRGSRVGSVFGMLAGVAMVCTGATAAALAGSHAAVAASAGSGCQVLPSAPTSPGPSPSQTASAGPNSSSVPRSASSSTNSTPTELCVTVAAQASSVNSGQNALYSITVSPKGGKADDVTVQISASSNRSSPATAAPAFTVCGKEANSRTCTLGTMNTSQATELQAKIAIPASAPSGDAVTLTATATGAAPGATASGSVIGSASVNAVAPTPTPTPTPTPSKHHHTGSGHHHSGGGSGGHHSGGGGSGGGGSGSNGSGGSTQNTNPLAGLSPLTTAGGGTNPGNPSGLFPTINPSSSATPGAPGTTASKTQRPYKATTAADVLPLNPDQLSTQVAALCVLGIGIILVFARISLRKPKGSETKS
jgi:uncharacterized membrane protein YgcG